MRGRSTAQGPRPLPQVGEVYEHLVVVETGHRTTPTRSHQRGEPGCLCRCECGREVVVSCQHLLTHHRRWCGQCRRRTDPVAGEKFGRLTVLSVAARQTGQAYPEGPPAQFLCDCGECVSLPVARVARGNTKSCGCLMSSADRSRRATGHGLTGHPLFPVWAGFMKRCYDPQADGYERYGGRGIRVCAEWHDVSHFVAWAAEHLPPQPAGARFARLDRDSNFEPANVSWATGDGGVVRYHQVGKVEAVEMINVGRQLADADLRDITAPLSLPTIRPV